MANDFGKDLGLVHEAVVMGRKVGAGKEFWAALAGDEELFRYLTVHVRDYVEAKALYEKFVRLGIDPKTPFSEDLSDLREVLDGISRFIPGRHAVPGKTMCCCTNPGVKCDEVGLKSLLHDGESDEENAVVWRLVKLGFVEFNMPLRTEDKPQYVLNYHCCNIEGTLDYARARIRQRKIILELFCK